MIPQPGDTIDIALDCLKAHPKWFLFPIKRLEKFPPCFEDNLRLASNNPDQIKKWYASFPGCNWGVALKKSKLICVDVDSKPGKNGQQTLDDLELVNGPLPDTLTVRTPSGGAHYYFDEANGVVHQMRLNAFGKDVDSTNYTLLPGCWLSTSAVQGYEIINNKPVAPTPGWFKEYLAEKIAKPVDQAPAVEQDTKDIVQRAIFYLQNDAKPSIQSQNGEFALLMTAAVLKDMGISQELAVDLLNEYYNVPGMCEPQWGVGEGSAADRLDMKVANAWSYLKNTQPGARSPQAEFGDDEDRINENDIEAMARVWKRTPGNPVRSNLDDAVTAATKDARIEEAAKDTEVTAGTDADPMFDPAEPEDVGAVEVEAAREPVKNLRLPAINKIDWTVNPTNIKQVCERWVWVTQLKRFLNRQDPTQQWDTAQFDSMFNTFLSKKGSISKDLFAAPSDEKGSVLRKYHYVAFRPGAKEVAGVEYNVWRPSPITPVAGDTTVWNEHINNLFQNETDAKHVLDWMAWVLQNPNRKPNHALLIVGKNTGTGKSLVATIFEQLIGVKNTQRPKNSSMGGDFNGWLRDCRLCIVEEVYQVGRRENLNAMRDILTEARVEVNIKGIPAFVIENFVAVMGVSNHTDALPIDKYDRRWLIVETFATRQDRDYYEPLFQLARGRDKAGLAAIYYDLLNRDLKGYNGLDAAPETAARERMIELSRPDVETWLIENMGNPPLSRDVVTIQDIVNAMPAKMQNEKRLVTATVPNFLRDRCGAEKLANQRRLRSGSRVYLWVLHNRFSMYGEDADFGAIYEKELKKDRAETEITAAEDFGAEED